MDEHQTHGRLMDPRAMTRTGPLKIWAGKGAGQSCAHCGKPIERRHVEYEFNLGAGPCRMHLQCFVRWNLGSLRSN